MGLNYPQKINRKKILILIRNCFNFSNYLEKLKQFLSDLLLWNAPVYCSHLQILILCNSQPWTNYSITKVLLNLLRVKACIYRLGCGWESSWLLLRFLLRRKHQSWPIASQRARREPPPPRAAHSLTISLTRTAKLTGQSQRLHTVISFL